MKAVIPPVSIFNPVFEAFIRDLDRFYNNKKKGKDFKIPGDLVSTRNIPLIGKLYYNYMGRGAEFHAKRREKGKKKKIKTKRKPYGRP